MCVIHLILDCVLFDWEEKVVARQVRKMRQRKVRARADSWRLARKELVTGGVGCKAAVLVFRSQEKFDAPKTRDIHHE